LEEIISLGKHATASVRSKLFSQSWQTLISKKLQT